MLHIHLKTTRGCSLYMRDLYPSPSNYLPLLASPSSILSGPNVYVFLETEAIFKSLEMGL